MKEHWLLDPEIVFLNHGSFGATPKAVLAKQDEFRRQLEREPVRFMVRELEPLLDAARSELAQFIGADADGMAFVPNATAGVNAVLRSLDLDEHDELLVTNQEYNACRNALDYVAQLAGAKVIVVDTPFPVASSDNIAQRILDRITARTRLLLIDHITSQTAIIQPVERLVREMAARGIDTLVDGAHAPGMVPLDVRAIGAAYYAGNLHKWVCAPKGAGFLYVRENRRYGVRPIAISHGANSTRADRSRFLLEFDWTGTFDPSAWLAVPEAIRFIGSLVDGGWPEVMRRNRALALRGRDILARALGMEPPAPDEMLGSMAALPLPDGSASTAPSLYGDPLQDELLEKFKIEVPVVPWPEPPKRVLRISAQLYNEEREYEKLADALTKLV
ncbi:MAG TPA: aminotransferase class V-fold PLP-dependent enzyme [Thermoanaerobaculia bacterium]|jgi:isopenicillin-N epimerase|nr:aminotransferase class V-fold PLP-dependent enzyme [Thermoanaerobaculia bacterium]